MIKTFAFVLALATMAVPSWGQEEGGCPTWSYADGFLRLGANLLFSYASGEAFDSTDEYNIDEEAVIYQGASVLHEGGDAEYDVGADVGWSDTLQSVFTSGDFAETATFYFYDDSDGSCNDYYLDDSQTITISLPTVTVPGGGYHYAWWYLGGNPSIDGYSQTASFTGNPNLGDTCDGCSPTYSWAVVTQPTGTTPLSFSPSSSTTTTATSQAASTSGTWDTSFVFMVDGFASGQVLVNLNTPKGIWVNSTSTVSNPDSCPNPNVYGGYDYQIKYYIADLWNWAISALTTNEKNDTYTDDTSIGSGTWHYASPPEWVDDDTWSAADWDPLTPVQLFFTDHITASNCASGWTPPPLAPQSPSPDSAVQETPQYWHTANATSGSGIAIGNDTQKWYTDHGDRY